MTDEHDRAHPASPPGGKTGQAALEREATHIETITASKGGDEHGPDDAVVHAETVKQVEQEARVTKIAREAKEAGEGSNGSEKPLNQDG